MGGHKDLSHILYDIQKVEEIGATAKQWLILPTAKQLRETEAIQAKFVCRPWIPHRAITEVFGRTGTMKTRLMIFLGKALSEGTHFLRKPTMKMPVYYIAYETPVEEFKDRFNVLDVKNLVLWHRGLKKYFPQIPPPPKLDDREFVSVFQGFPEGFFIFDSLKPGMRHGDIKENKDLSRVFHNLRNLCDLGHTVILLNNTTKADEEKFTGGQTQEDEADQMLLLTIVKAPGSSEEEKKLTFKEQIKRPVKIEIVDKSRFTLDEDELNPVWFRYDPEHGIYLVGDPQLETLAKMEDVLLGLTEKKCIGDPPQVQVEHEHWVRCWRYG